MLLTLPVLDPMWLNAAEFDIAVSSTAVLRWASGTLGLSVLFNVIVNINVSLSSFPFIFYSKLLVCLNLLFFTVRFHTACQFLDISHLPG